MDGLVSLLALADSRLPAGGHAHSGGVEPAMAAGLIRDLDDLAVFLRGRLRTAGAVSAAVAAAACHRAAGADAAVWQALDAETDARTASPAQRVASRQQGRALLRAGSVAWPSPLLAGLASAIATAAAPAAPNADAANRTCGAPVPTTGARSHDYPASPIRSEAPAGGGGAPVAGPHHAVALGAVGAAAGCDPAGVAHVAAYLTISGPAAAAVRLRGYDPFAVQALLAALTPEVTAVAQAGAAAAEGPLRDLPCPTAPRLDLLAELHAISEVRLFAS